MPDYFRYATPTALQTLITGAELQNLASGSVATGAFVEDNTPGTGDLEGDFELAVAYESGPPASGTRVADLYIEYSVDGTNFPSNTNVPEETYVGSFVSRNGSTSTLERIPLTGISLRPLKFKAALKNVSGVNFKNDTNNVLIVQPSQGQAVAE